MGRPTGFECAYAAGFFDGEGSVSIETRRLVKHSATLNWRLSVRVSQVDPAPLQQLRSIWGGSICFRQPGKRSVRPYYQWSISTARAEQFLKDIASFAIVKQREIGIALEFRALIGRATPGRKGLSPADVAERMRLKDEIRSRNRWALSNKGVAFG
jgi:hypothetical protein